jgi:hypothetical protein
MDRSLLASVLDTVAVGALAYGAFRFGVAVAPCKDQGECIILTPVVIACLVAAVVTYFAAGFVLFRSTPGQRVFGTHDEEPG